jgi:hypothetical protein
MNWSATASLGDRMAFAPERLLMTADSAVDLRRAPDQAIDGKAQVVLTFTWKGSPVTLSLDRAMHLPTRSIGTYARLVEALS